jgi:hypothetical protein
VVLYRRRLNERGCFRSRGSNANCPSSEWDQITTGSGSWFVYGGGGIGGTGSLCGVPNGVCLVLNMCGQHGHAAKVMDYYNWTQFPTVNVELAYDADEWIAPVPIPSDFLTPTVAESPTVPRFHQQVLRGERGDA